MHREGYFVNVRMIVQILLDGRLQVGNEVIMSPVDVVLQVERGRWRCQAYMDQVENLLKVMPPMKEHVLPNLIELDTSQTLGADCGRLRA